MRLKKNRFKKKVLFVATVDSHLKSFHLPYMKWFQLQGWEVHAAANGKIVLPNCDKQFIFSIKRYPFKLNNLFAYKKLKYILRQEKYDIIHCHTPMGGVLARLAARRERKNGTMVIYTAHGFHFFKGAQIKNWVLYYPVEKILAKYTDCLITTNKEDYKRAKSRFKARSIKYVNGVGVDLDIFKPQTPETKEKIREEYGYNRSAFIVFFAGELSYRKHQDLLIKSISLLQDKIPNIKLILAGTGNMLRRYQTLTKQLGIEDKVDFIGFRKDIENIFTLSDIAASSSRQEGLPVNVMMAMATGLPIIVTNCRGNRDLITDGKNGYLVDVDDINGFANKIEKLYESEELRNEFSKNNLASIKEYSIERIKNQMEKIYNNLIYLI